MVKDGCITCRKPVSEKKAVEKEINKKRRCKDFCKQRLKVKTITQLKSSHNLI